MFSVPFTSDMPNCVQNFPGRLAWVKERFTALTNANAIPVESTRMRLSLGEDFIVWCFLNANAQKHDRIYAGSSIMYAKRNLLRNGAMRATRCSRTRRPDGIELANCAPLC